MLQSTYKNHDIKVKNWVVYNIYWLLINIAQYDMVYTGNKGVI